MVPADTLRTAYDAWEASFPKTEGSMRAALDAVLPAMEARLSRRDTFLVERGLWNEFITSSPA